MAYDFGVKTNSLREFAKFGCRVTVVPARHYRCRYNGFKTRRHLSLKRPRRSGVDVVGRRRDKETSSLKNADVRHLPRPSIDRFEAFGARNLQTKIRPSRRQPADKRPDDRTRSRSRRTITASRSQPTRLPTDVEVTHINLNDQTVAGLRHKTLPVFSVQYHPESAPGPHDSEYLFERFIKLIGECD